MLVCGGGEGGTTHTALTKLEDGLEVQAVIVSTGWAHKELIGVLGREGGREGGRVSAHVMLSPVLCETHLGLDGLADSIGQHGVCGGVGCGVPVAT